MYRSPRFRLVSWFWPCALAFPASVHAATFVPVGPMAVARSEHTTTVLGDGTVLVAGGSFDRRAELYDPASAMFSILGNMVAPRIGHTATLLPDGRILLTGGFSLSGATASAEIYDPITRTFSSTGSLSTARRGHAATLLLDGTVLVTGGSSSGHPINASSSAEIYQPTLGSFSSAGTMNSARQNHSATRLGDGRVLIAGGFDATQLGLSSAELYTPGSGFSPLANLGEGRGEHSATLLEDGRVLLVGGFDGFPGAGRASAELFTPGSGFAPAATLAAQRGAHGAARLLDGSVLIAGGFVDFPIAPALASAEVYSADRFDPAPAMDEARGRLPAVRLANGDVLICGGLNPSLSQLRTAGIYRDFPTATQVTRIETRAEARGITVEWSLNEPPLQPVSVYRKDPGSPWALHRRSADGSHRVVFVDPHVVGGQRYGYRLGLADPSREHFLGEVWVVAAGAPRLALLPARPNPAHGPLEVQFSLAEVGIARIELVDALGRQRERRNLEGLPAGSHAVTMGSAGLEPGVYWIRLVQGSVVRTARVAVVR